MRKYINSDWKKITGRILLLTLVLSIGYAVYKIIVSPVDGSISQEYEHIKSDYILMLIQCTLGLVVMFLPNFLEKKWSVFVPNYMSIMYFIFLFCAIFLGEVRNFYYTVPHWDTILHAFSGAMLGALGFSLVSILNEFKSKSVSLSPFFVSVFAFSFALSIGAVWEIYEYICDSILDLNMQKYLLADGTKLVGRAALKDTMKDIIVDALSAFVVSVIGYISLKKRSVD